MSKVKDAMIQREIGMYSELCDEASESNPRKVLGIIADHYVDRDLTGYKSARPVQKKVLLDNFCERHGLNRTRVSDEIDAKEVYIDTKAEQWNIWENNQVFMVLKKIMEEKKKSQRKRMFDAATYEPPPTEQIEIFE